MTKLALIGDKNYLKRDESSGSTNMSGPTASAPWGFPGFYSTHPVTHNLNIIPMVRVYYEPFSDGKIYPATGSRVSGIGPGLSLGDIVCLWELTETTLTIYLESTSSSATPVPVYWIIYKDIPRG